MTWLDVAIIATICLCAAFGFWRGILRMAIGIAGLLCGILMAGALHQRLALLLWPSGGSWSLAVAYIFVLLSVLAITAIVATLVARAVYQTPFGILDRMLGLAVGILIAVSAWALIITILLILFPAGRELIADSPVAQLIVRLLATFRGLPQSTSELALIV